MGIIKKLTVQLKRINKALTTGFNFLLVFLIYWVGVSFSFLFLKASEIREKKRRVEGELKTYWIDYERDSEDYHRQY